MADAPRAYWRLGETSGSTAVNEVGGGTLDGTYQNGVTLGVTGALAGDPNLAVGFDGTNDQVSMGDPANGSLDFGTSDFSVEAWVRGTANGERVIVSKRSTEGSSPYWQATVTDDSGHVGEVRASIFDGVASIAAYGPAIRVDDSAWHHVAVVFDRDVGVTVWVDGSSRTTSGAATRSISNSGSLIVGKSPSSFFPYFQGRLDEIALFPTALSGTKVLSHRNAGLGLAPPPPAPSYRSTVLTDAPRSYWRLGETSGTTAANEIAGGQTGAYQNGVVLGVTGVLVGDMNRAAGFDGTNDQVSMGDPANGSLDFGASDFSVEAWVRTSVNGERVIASKRSAAAGTPYWQVTVTDDDGRRGEIRANVFDGTVSRTAYGPSGLRVDNGAWHHVVVVFDRDFGMVVWVDGVSRTSTGSFTGSLSNAGSFLIGKSPSDSFPYFSGTVDEVAVYPSMLSAARVEAHRNAALGTSGESADVQAESTQQLPRGVTRAPF